MDISRNYPKKKRAG